MSRIIETENLYLRSISANDVPKLFKIHNSTAIAKNAKLQPFSQLTEVTTFFNRESANGFGTWVICDTKQGELIGYCSFYQLNKNPESDLSIYLLEKHWRKGFATEVLKGIILYAFNVLRTPEINTHIVAENNVGQKVALNNGFTLTKNGVYQLKNTLVYAKEITAKDTLAIRNQILRKGYPIDACIFDGDNDIHTFHIGLYYYSMLIGVASYMKNNSNHSTETVQYQLRGMALLPKFQGKKLGNVLLEKGMDILENKQVNLLWCNARTTAVSFYKAFGFTTHGNTFEIPSVGTHIKMTIPASK